MSSAKLMTLDEIIYLLTPFATAFFGLVVRNYFLCPYDYFGNIANEFVACFLLINQYRKKACFHAHFSL